MSKAEGSRLFPRARWGLVGAAAIGFAGFAAGLALKPSQAWTAFLVSNFFFLTLSLGGLLFIAMMAVANAGWHRALKRVPESLAAYLPIGGLATLCLLRGVPWLYSWAQPEAARDTLLRAQSPYLNIGFFAARMVGVLVIWILLGTLMRSTSISDDKQSRRGHSRRNVVLSAVFLAVFPFSFSMAAIDWLMSLQPHWSSSIFGLYNIAGLLSAAVGAISVVVIMLRRRGALPNVSDDHLHDLGKLLFGFSTVWAYLWFSQYLLVWYTNLPEENAYYVARLTGSVSVLFFLNFLLGWTLPFALLLRRSAKRSERTLLAASTLVLAGRWLDIHILAAPAVAPVYHGISVIDIALLLAFGGLFLFTIDRALAKAPAAVLPDVHIERPQAQPVRLPANPAKESLYES